MAEYDVVIKGGTVIDGTRMPRFRADVGVKDGRIVPRPVNPAVPATAKVVLLWTLCGGAVTGIGKPTDVEDVVTGKATVDDVVPGTVMLLVDLTIVTVRVRWLVSDLVMVIVL